MDEITAEGFVLLRTPLLPLEKWYRWTQQALPAPLPRELGAAFFDALYLASPGLSSNLHEALASPDARKRTAASVSLLSYFTRAATRCTPANGFAGTTLGDIGARTEIEFMPAGAAYKTLTVDLCWVVACCRELEREPQIREQLRFAVNPSIWRQGGKYRYLEPFRKTQFKNHQWFRVSTVDATDYLSHLLREAGSGATIAELARSLAEFSRCTTAQSRLFVDDLIAESILISELQPPLVGIDPGIWLQRRLAALGETQRATGLESVLEQLRQPPFLTPGTNIRDYHSAAAKMRQIVPQAEFHGRSIFFANLWKPASRCRVGQHVIDQVQKTLLLLLRIAPRAPDRLRNFRRDFHERYGERDVPLLEVMDEQIGVPTAGILDGPPAQLSRAVPRRQEEPARSWPERDAQLLQWVTDTIRNGDGELQLEGRELQSLESTRPGPLLSSFFVNVNIAAVSAEHIDRGEYRFSIGGYMPTASLGRFAQDSPELAAKLQAIAQRDVDYHQERGAVLAELAHYPAGENLNNILVRPRFLDHEIALFCGSQLDREHCLRPDELTVAVRGSRVALRCPRLGREVVARMHNAHRFDLKFNLRLYRFINDVSRQDVRDGPAWSWGGLDKMPFLPRVTHGRALLTPTRWRVKREQLYPTTQRETERIRGVAAFRHRAGLPRFVVLAQNDSRLPIDLDNELSVRVLVRQAQSWPDVVLEELFPLPRDLWVTDDANDGCRFVAEWLVPFRGTFPAPTSSGSGRETASARPRRATPEQRVFAPGSEWLYAKFYLASALQNQLLTQDIRTLLLELEQHSWMDRWFFIRYQDPEMHVRLRLHCAPGRDPAELLRRVTAAGGALLEAGACWRFQLDTYDREIERFGIEGSMVWAENWFHRDSRAVLETLAQHAGLSPDHHWLLAAAGLDCLLGGFCFDDVARKLLMIHCRDVFRSEFGSSKKEIQAAGELFRQFRPQLLETIRRTRGLAGPKNAGGAIGDLHSLRELGEKHPVDPVDAGLPSVGPLISRELAADFCHLHCNRMLHGSQRMQELVIYDLLVRAYDAITNGVWSDGQ